MRRVLIADLIAASKALASIAPQRRAQTMQSWLHQTHAAHLYTKRLGKAHPNWGIGTLESRLARAALAARPPFDLGDANMLDALGHVIAALQTRRAHQGAVSLALPTKPRLC